MVAPPEFTTPEEFAAHMGWSARRIRQIAREHGACRIAPFPPLFPAAAIILAIPGIRNGPGRGEN